MQNDPDSCPPEGQASPMTGYIVEYDEGIETEISKVMPGVVWKTWQPVYSDLAAHGKLMLTVKETLIAHLKTQSSHEDIILRRLKIGVKAVTVDRNTWNRALKQALIEIPQWKQQGQRLKWAA